MNAPNFKYWRSPLIINAAEWADCGDAELPELLEDEITATAAGICDLSALPRIGGKGECADNAPAPNHAVVLPEGGMCCRLSDNEILLLSAADGKAASMEHMMPSPRLLIPRRDSHCLFGLCGEQSAAVLARLCAIPPPKPPHLAQTIVADIGAIIVAEPHTDNAFYLLADNGYAVHLWNSLNAAAKAIGGGMIGWKQWRSLFN